MAKCTLCNVELGFSNKPTFGAGKLSDGNEICRSCYSKLNNIPNISLNIKKMNAKQIEDVYYKYGRPEARIITEENNETQTVVNNEINQRVQEIGKQLQKLNLDSATLFSGRREINELHNILSKNESVLGLVKGSYQQRTGILAATESRVIFVDKGLIGLKVEEFNYKRINSIQYETGMLFGKIIIHGSGNSALIDNVDKGRIKYFVDFVREKIEVVTNQSHTSPQTVIVNQQVDIADQLSKLATLRDQGILTDEEFQAQKKKLLL